MSDEVRDPGSEIIETPAEDTQEGTEDLAPEIKLRHPVEFEGRTIAKINLDLMKLDGQAICNAEKAYYASGGRPGVSSLSTHFCMVCAAMAAGEPIEAMMKLKGQDAMEVTLAIQIFLLGGD